MQNQNVNSFQSPKQQFSRVISQATDFNINQISGTPKVSSNRDNLALINSPYFATVNLNQGQDKNQRNVVRNNDYRLLKTVTNEQTNFFNCAQNEMVDFKKDISALRIDNKYGLEVRKIERTPRTSHTDAELKLGSHKPHSSFVRTDDSYILNEKKSIDFFQAKHPDFSQTLSNNSINHQLPLSQKGVQSMQTIQSTTQQPLKQPITSIQCNAINE